MKERFVKFYRQIINISKVNCIYKSYYEIGDEKKWMIVFEFENKTTIKHVFESEEKCNEIIDELFLNLKDV